jgi:epsilon-lactone hydrolase
MNKRKLAIALGILAALAAGLLITQSRIFKPSLGARIARMAVKLYLAPAFASDDLVDDVRSHLENISMLAMLPSGTKVEEVDLGGMKADWVSASGQERAKQKKVILYIHGGGFFAGSRNTHRELVARISRASGLPALVPEYRRAPENKFPAALDDSLAAYRWLLEQGYSPKDIAIGGDSAGGCLTMMTLLSLRDDGSGLPGAAFLISPLTDAVHHDGETMKTKAEIDPMFDPKDQPRHLRLFTDNARIDSPLLSPVRQSLEGLPPILIQVGTDEILLSDSTRLAESAKKAGVDATLQIWEGMWHDFQAFAVLAPEARDAIDGIGEFLKKHI